jgi:predicted RNase H-like HicB family nuclease
VDRTINIGMSIVDEWLFFRTHEKTFRLARCGPSIGRQVGAMMTETHYLALIHKDEQSGYGISFPDVPGIIAVADTLDDAISEAASALDFAFEDWAGPLPQPRTLETLRHDP